MKLQYINFCKITISKCNYKFLHEISLNNETYQNANWKGCHA